MPMIDSQRVTTSPAHPAAERPGAPRVLILGGSSEATALVAALAGSAAAVVLSLAGRTGAPVPQPVATRVGGFGGVAGLVAHLRAARIDVLVDATHPFAAQMSRHAREAAAVAGCRLLAVTRPAWVPQPGDDWREVATMAEAAAALGAAPRRAFLTVGRLQLAAFAAAPQHHYLVRSIDPVAPGHGLAQARFVAARGPFAAAAEERLMREHGTEVLVTKNSGGDASAAKLVAARRLGLSVILVARPLAAGVPLGVEQAVAAIAAHRVTAPDERGV